MRRLGLKINILLFLASNWFSDSITGSTLTVDAGLSLHNHLLDEMTYSGQ